MSDEMLTLWGTPHSFYTGKVRSYLIKKGLPFRELMPSHPRFHSHVLPAIGFMAVPVLEFPDGSLLQDSTDIIGALETRFPANPMLPSTPVQACIARLMGAFGSEGMLPAGMHYRWSYRAEQDGFLRAEFGRAVYSGTSREERSVAGAALMDYFSGFLAPLGVTPETIPAVEAAHEAMLEALDLHFQYVPYLLGGHPSIADFGFMAPLFAHLGRDPVPASLMKRRAPNVYRWTERMNSARIVDPEFPDLAPGYPPDDAIAPTLEPVLSLMFADWGAQLLADAAHANAWLTANAALPPGSLLSHDGERRVHPILGTISYPWRGVTVSRACMPNGLWRFVEVANAARRLVGDARERLAAIVERNGGAEVMRLGLVRPLRREANVLVLA